MVELGELEARHADFDNRKARILVVSLEDRETAGKTQEQFRHLKPVADADGRLIDVANVRHHHAAPDGRDAAAPTTILIDRAGTVRWIFRPERYLTRLSPDELLAAVDEHLAATPMSAQ